MICERCMLCEPDIKTVSDTMYVASKNVLIDTVNNFQSLRQVQIAKDLLIEYVSSEKVEYVKEYTKVDVVPNLIYLVAFFDLLSYLPEEDMSFNKLVDYMSIWANDTYEGSSYFSAFQGSEPKDISELILQLDTLLDKKALSFQ